MIFNFRAWRTPTSAVSCAALSVSCRGWAEGQKSYASAGNRTRVTSMATMYSTTRPLMLVMPPLRNGSCVRTTNRAAPRATNFAQFPWRWIKRSVLFLLLVARHPQSAPKRPQSVPRAPPEHHQSAPERIRAHPRAFPEGARAPQSVPACTPCAAAGAAAIPFLMVFLIAPSDLFRAAPIRRRCRSGRQRASDAEAALEQSQPSCAVARLPGAR